MTVKFRKRSSSCLETLWQGAYRSLSNIGPASLLVHNVSWGYAEENTCICVYVYAAHLIHAFPRSGDWLLRQIVYPRMQPVTGPGCASDLWCNPLLPLCDGTWEN